MRYLQRSRIWDAIFEVTGKAVIYTAGGVKVVDAEVRRMFNAHADWNVFAFKHDEPYLLIGGARTVPTNNPYAQPAYHPQTIDLAVAYAETKTFRLLLDLMRLAQFEPISPFNRPLFYYRFRDNQLNNTVDKSLDVTSDAALYRHFKFSPQMIRFTEDRYHDELHDD